MDDDYRALQERLGALPDKLSYSVMVRARPRPRAGAGRGEGPPLSPCVGGARPAGARRQRQPPGRAGRWVRLPNRTPVTVTGGGSALLLPRLTLSFRATGTGSRGAGVRTGLAHSVCRPLCRELGSRPTGHAAAPVARAGGPVTRWSPRGAALERRSPVRGAAAGGARGPPVGTAAGPRPPAPGPPPRCGRFFLAGTRALTVRPVHAQCGVVCCPGPDVLSVLETH